MSIHKLLCADISQGKDRVDSQEQSGVDRNQLQTLQARRPARQGLRVGLPQPVHVGLEAKEWTLREMKGWDHMMKAGLRDINGRSGLPNKKWTQWRAIWFDKRCCRREGLSKQKQTGEE